MSDETLNSSKSQIQKTLDVAFARQVREGFELVWPVKELEHLENLSSDPFVTWLRKELTTQLQKLIPEDRKEAIVITTKLEDGNFTIRLTLKLGDVKF